MKPDPDHQQLLADLLAEDAGAAGRAASLAQLLRLARRRRQVRFCQRAGAVAALLVLAAFAVLRPRAPQTAAPGRVPANPPPAGLAWVTTRPLAPTESVTSQPLRPDQLVASGAQPNLVTTGPANYREVGDAELLELAAPRIAALVRRGPHEAELLFVAAAPASSPP